MQHTTFSKVSLVSRCGYSRCGNPLFWLPLLAVAGLVLFFTACPEKNNPPPIADCDPGWHPCGTDSTECCLDTTSHNFVWEIDTLGDYGSYLNDVAIIDENNVWVVGEIETDSDTYNAAHWDGREWRFVSVPVPIIGPDGVVGHATFTLQSVLAFNGNSIWFTGGGVKMVKWDGNQFTDHFAPYQSIEGSAVELWGTSESDIFLVGNEGLIVHYDGSGFEKMESGTDVDLHSISGTGANNVWVSGWNYYDLHRILLHYNGYEWDKIIDDYTNNEEPNRIKGRIAGVYTDNPDFVWVLTHKGLYKCNSNTTGEGKWLGEQSDPTSWVYAFAGSNHNDLFYGGSFTRLWHYNGSSFHFYHDIPDMGRIYGVGVTKSIVVVVGELINTSQAFVIRGYR